MFDSLPPEPTVDHEAHVRPPDHPSEVRDDGGSGGQLPFLRGQLDFQLTDSLDQPRLLSGDRGRKEFQQQIRACKASDLLLEAVTERGP